MQRLRPPGSAGRRCSALLMLGLVSLLSMPVLRVAAEPSYSPFSSLAASFRSYMPLWGQPTQHRRLQQVDEPDQLSTTCAELQYTCSDPNSDDSGCGELCALTFTISAPLYQLISNGSCTDLDADLGLWRCGQNLVQASTVNLVRSSQCVQTCKEPAGASKSCSAPPAPAPAPLQPSVSAPAPAPFSPIPMLAAAPAPMTRTGPAATVVAVPAPGPSSSLSSQSPSPTPASTSSGLQSKVLDAFVSAPPRMVASPPPPPSVSCFDGPVVTATTLICGLTAASLNTSQLEAAIAASLLYNNATYTTIILDQSTADTVGPGCAANSTGSSQITAATTSCTAAATPIIVVAPDVDAATYIQQVLATFPQNIAVGLPSSTSLGPVCVNYQAAPGRPCSMCACLHCIAQL